MDLANSILGANPRVQISKPLAVTLDDATDDCNEQYDSGSSPKSHRLFITDDSTKTQFLVDTEANLSVFPRTMVPGRRKRTDYELYAQTVRVSSRIAQLYALPDK